MPEKILGLFSSIPFFLNIDGKMKFNSMRIIESLIQAVILGALFYFAFMSKMENIELKLTHIIAAGTIRDQQVTLLCDKIDRMRDDMVRIDTLQKERIERERKAYR